jgi:hypothetical protein
VRFSEDAISTLGGLGNMHMVAAEHRAYGHDCKGPASFILTRWRKLIIRAPYFIEKFAFIEVEG